MTYNLEQREYKNTTCYWFSILHQERKKGHARMNKEQICLQRDQSHQNQTRLSQTKMDTYPPPLRHPLKFRRRAPRRQRTPLPGPRGLRSRLQVLRRSLAASSVWAREQARPPASWRGGAQTGRWPWGRQHSSPARGGGATFAGADTVIRLTKSNK